MYSKWPTTALYERRLERCRCFSHFSALKRDTFAFIGTFTWQEYVKIWNMYVYIYIYLPELSALYVHKCHFAVKVHILQQNTVSRYEESSNCMSTYLPPGK